VVSNSAAAIDAAVAGLPPSLVVDIQEHATLLHLRRAIHRSVHVDQIEALVGKGEGDRSRASSQRGAQA
jgi:hypothetical protein